MSKTTELVERLRAGAQLRDPRLRHSAGDYRLCGKEAGGGQIPQRDGVPGWAIG